MLAVLAVLIGGILGTAARLGLDDLIPHTPTTFPLSTLIINVAGSLILGILIARVWPTAPSATVLVVLSTSTSWAGGMESLEAFIKNARSGRAEFTQVVTAPARDGQPSRTKTSSGTFEFQRPGKFRFDYKKPFAQSIVADGKILWLWLPVFCVMFPTVLMILAPVPRSLP